jgi:hypothetical protein
VTSDAWPISAADFVEAGVSKLDLLALSDEITLATKSLCEQSGMVIVAQGANSL